MYLLSVFLHKHQPFKAFVGLLIPERALVQNRWVHIEIG